MIEELGTTVRIDSDGYPEAVVPALERIVRDGLLGAFASQAEYSYIASDMAQYNRHAPYFTSGPYIEVPNVGWAFAKPIVMSGVMSESGEVVFSQDEEYGYVVTKDGEIRVLD